LISALGFILATSDAMIKSANEAETSLRMIADEFQLCAPAELPIVDASQLYHQSVHSNDA
jgi:hypothetical protein